MKIGIGFKPGELQLLPAVKIQAGLDDRAHINKVLHSGPDGKAVFRLMSHREVFRPDGDTDCLTDGEVLAAGLDDTAWRFHLHEVSGNGMNLAVKNVGLADEVGDKTAIGVIVDFQRAVNLKNNPVPHDGNAVRHGHGLFLVVRDIDERDPQFLLQPFQLDLHLFAKLQIQRTEGLVQKKNTGVVDQGTGNGDALLLAA